MLPCTLLLPLLLPCSKLLSCEFKEAALQLYRVQYILRDLLLVGSLDAGGPELFLVICSSLSSAVIVNVLFFSTTNISIQPKQVILDCTGSGRVGAV